MITNTEPNINLNGKYNVHDTAEILGVATKTLREWTKRGYIRCEFMTIANRRYYTGKEILRAWKSKM